MSHGESLYPQMDKLKALMPQWGCHEWSRGNPAIHGRVLKMTKRNTKALSSPWLFRQNIFGKYSVDWVKENWGFLERACPVISNRNRAFHYFFNVKCLLATRGKKNQVYDLRTRHIRPAGPHLTGWKRCGKRSLTMLKSDEDAVARLC